MIAPVTAARTTATLGSERTEFAVSGMTCASCVSHVTKALMRVPGVSDARVNLATERAVVAHSPSVATELLEAAVAKAGYAAHSVSANAALRDDADARTRETRRRRNVLFFGLALLVPSLVLGMLPIAFSGKDWVMFALALPAWGFVGFDFHRGALARLQHGSANMDTLVSLGSTAAIGYSIYATFTMQPTYFETAVAIVVLIYLGKYLEVAARGRTNVAIRKLLALRPTTALLRTSEGGTRPVGVDDLKLDDIVVVKSGEGFPIDGVVVRGQSTVDASMLTGEAVPVEVEPGSNVSGGTINGDGTLDVRATAVGAGTALARIVRIVQEAQGSQAPIQRTADRIAGVFVPVILAIAALTFIAWLVVGQPWSVAIPIAVAVLVVACPCAMGLATPMAIMVGIGRGAELGILFKDAEAVERAGAITRVVFDKTGTLTAGKPAVTEFTAVPGVEAREVLRLAATVERESAHPLAAAIVYAAEQQALAFGRVRDVVAERGRGISATVDGNRIFAGTREYLTSAGVPADRFIAHPRPADSATVVWVSSGAQLLGRIALADVARPQSREAVAALGDLNIATAIVSGDADGPVQAIATVVGIAETHARTLPEDKAAYVRELRARGEHVAFVGDGINDAPALASADVGFAMGSGSEIAIEAAGAAILSNDPRAIAVAIRLSRATTRTIRGNLFWAFAYNAILVPLAAFGVVRPIFAAGAMAVSSLFVVGNSLLLRRR